MFMTYSVIIEGLHSKYKWTIGRDKVYRFRSGKVHANPSQE